MVNTPKYILIHTEANTIITEKDRFDAVNAYHKSGAKDFPKSSLGFFCGYHYFVERTGRYVQARQDIEWGAHCNNTVNGKSMNVQSISLCFAGNGDLQLPTPTQTATLRHLVQEKMKLWNILKENVKCHRDYDQTGKTCPGKLVTDEWIRKNLIDAVSIPISPKPPDMPIITRKYEAVELMRLQTQLSLLQKLVALFVRRKQLLGSMSKTQLSNINTFAGFLVMILPKLGIVVSYEQLAFFIGALWSVGWTIYNYYQRYQKGDLSLGGYRK